MDLSLHSKILTLFPVLFLQSLYVPFNSENVTIYLYNVGQRILHLAICIVNISCGLVERLFC